MPVTPVDLAFDPRDAGQVDAAFVLQQPLDEDRGGHGVHRQTDAAPYEVLRGLHQFAVDSYEAVPEGARRKYRNCNKWALPGGKPRDELGAGIFGGVELLRSRHAVEDFARRIDVDEVEFDAIDRHGAGVERQHAVVEATGERQFHLVHVYRPCNG